jgi:uncharacterized protein
MVDNCKPTISYESLEASIPNSLIKLALFVGLFAAGREPIYAGGCEVPDPDACLAKAEEYFREGNFKIAMGIAKDSCQLGHVDSCHALGYWHEKRSTPRLAEPFYQSACDEGVAKSCNNLGYIMERQGKTKSAFAKYLLGCRQDHRGSCQNVLRLNENKLFQPTDYFKLALPKTVTPTQLEASCLGGAGEACNRLGWSFKQIGDIANALKFFDIACNNEESKGCNNYAQMSHMLGKMTLADQYFDKGCQFGNTRSCNNRNYVRNTFQEKKAVALKQKQLCDSGDGKACYRLALIADKTKKASQQSLELFVKSCENQFPAGCNRSGWILQERGQQSQANELFRKACQLFEAKGCSNLALYYYRKSRHHMARIYYNEACKQRHSRSCEKLATWKNLEPNDNFLQFFKAKSCRYGLTPCRSEPEEYSADKVEVSSPKAISAAEIIREKTRRKNLRAARRSACERGELIDCERRINLAQSIGSLDSATRYFAVACDLSPVKWCAQHGELVAKRDKAQAETIFWKACGFGDYRSCENLGKAKVEKGEVTQAKTFLERACEGGVRSSCLLVADLESSESKTLARHFYGLACRLGDLGACEKSSPEALEDEPETEECDEDNPEACLKRGKLAKAKGEIAEAKDYFAKACELGEEMGCYNLAMLELDF